MNTPSSSSYFSRQAWPVWTAFGLFVVWAGFFSVAPGQPFLEPITVPAVLANVLAELPGHLTDFAILLAIPAATLTALALFNRTRYRLGVLTAGLIMPFFVLGIEDVIRSFPGMVPDTLAAITGRQIGEFYADGEGHWVTTCWWLIVCLVIGVFEVGRFRRDTTEQVQPSQSC